eukprot:2743119-Prymnesium_polylepis.1
MVRLKEGGDFRVRFENLRFIKEDGEDGPSVPADGTEGAPQVHDTSAQGGGGGGGGGGSSWDALAPEEREAIENIAVVPELKKYEPSEEVKREMQAAKPKRRPDKVYVPKALQQPAVSRQALIAGIIVAAASMFMAWVFLTGVGRLSARSRARAAPARTQKSRCRSARAVVLALAHAPGVVCDA